MTMITSIFLSAYLVALATAQSSSVSFAYPRRPVGTTPTVIINVVDTIIVQWDSNFKASWLYLWCNLNTTGGSNWTGWLAQQVNTTGEASYSPFYNSDLNVKWDSARPFGCHFDLNYEHAVGKGINGPPIEITSYKGQSATTYGLQYTTTALPPSGSPNGTANITPTVPISTSTSTSPPGDNNSSSSSSSGLSTGATAGIAVGVVLGVFALAGIAFVVWRNRRKVKKLEERLPVVEQADKYDKPPQGVDVAPPYREEEFRQSYVMPQTRDVVELEPAKPPSELPGSGAVAGAGVGEGTAARGK